MRTRIDVAAVPKPIPPLPTWRNEMELEGGAWFLIEEYPMVPI